MAGFIRSYGSAQALYTTPMRTLAPSCPCSMWNATSQQSSMASLLSEKANSVRFDLTQFKLSLVKLSPADIHSHFTHYFVFQQMGKRNECLQRHFDKAVIL